MQTPTINAITLAAILTSPAIFAADLPGKGITVHPVQSPLPEETFQTEIINRALKQLGYDVAPIEEVEYNVAYTAISAGDATYMAVNWMPLQQDMYSASCRCPGIVVRAEMPAFWHLWFQETNRHQRI